MTKKLLGEDQFSLRCGLVVVTLLAVVFSLAGFLHRNWFHPRDVGREAQRRFDGVFTQNNWNGDAIAYFYDDRVRVMSSDIGDEELEQLLPILKDIYWLRYLELFGTRISDTGLATLRRELDDVKIVHAPRAPGMRP